MKNRFQYQDHKSFNLYMQASAPSFVWMYDCIQRSITLVPLLEYPHNFQFNPVPDSTDVDGF